MRGEIDNLAKIAGDLNMPLSVTDRNARLRSTKKEDVNSMTNW